MYIILRLHPFGVGKWVVATAGKV